MAVYNAYADRVPVYIVLGNILDAQWRRSDVEWTHAVQDAAAMVRDCTKWDDTPVSLSHFAESAVRAYKIAMTPPHGPGGPRGRRDDAGGRRFRDADRRGCGCRGSPTDRRRRAMRGAVAELAKMLVAADNPRIIAGRAARTPEGLALLVELAELLQAPVQRRPRSSSG